MELFGIGPLELLFILLLALIIFGPKDLEKTGKAIGRSLYKFIQSDIWKTLNQTSRKLRTLPNDLIRQAGLDELKEAADLAKASVDLKDPYRAGTSEPNPQESAPPGPENRIAPPHPDKDKPA